MIVLHGCGLLTLTQDLGRPGLAQYGVPPSGAADRASHRRANALVGNRPGAATLEIVAPGFACQFTTETVAALTGAPAQAHLDKTELPHDSVFHAQPGQRLILDRAPWGLRTYLAVRGGIDVPPVLGSRACDLLSRVGPQPCEPGDRLPIGTDTDEQDWRAPAPLERPGTVLTTPLRLTPDVDWVAGHDMAEHVYSVTPGGSRTALRLEGPPLRRIRQDEFPPQGLVRGAVQVPPDGLPIIFLADHPVTGGYPVIGVVDGQVVDQLAQLRPGDRIGFAPR